MGERMNKKLIIFIGIIFLIILGLFIFSEIQYQKVFLPEDAKEEEKVKKIRTKTTTPGEPKQELVKEEEKSELEKDKNKIGPLEKTPLEELKRRGAKKRKEKFDLTPSLDDLIKMKKERIKTY